MKKALTFSFALIFSLSLFAQDTIVVQTITRDNEARSGTYTFPDDGQSFEKILMLYNMRCKDNIVNTTGGNNVGCGEWDYSCNTFITDPTRTDSTAANHPSHIISNFSGEVFDYTEQTSYTYYQFEQHEVTYTDVQSEVAAAVGAGEQELVLSEEQVITRSQFLYTAEEMSAAGLSAGDITSLRMDMSSIGGEVPFMRIRLKETDKTSLDASSPDIEGFDEVYFLNTSFEAVGLHDFNFYEAFTWDGSSNLIVEFTFTGSGGNNGVKGDLTTQTMGIVNATVDHSLGFAGAGSADITESSLTNNVSDEITISFWSKGDADILPVNTTIIEGVNTADQRSVNVHLPWSNGQIYWDCGNVDGSYDRINKSAPAEAYAGTWTHWAFTKNTNTGSMKIYLNGEQWHSGTGMTRPIDIQALSFGKAANANTGYFGDVDELRIWNKELSAEVIQDHMFTGVDASHPNIANLLSYYKMDEGEGFVLNNEVSGLQAAMTGGPTWNTPRGPDLFKGFVDIPLRANMVFVQGEYGMINDETNLLLDSVANAVHVVTEYGTEGTDLVELGEYFYYPAGEMSILDEAGDVVGTVDVPTEGSINIETLLYYLKREAKFEILSLVTPYGIGLDLGDEGKTFVFDVTDYAPILRGERFMSMEMGGQRQEEMDIKFLFITGTPPAEVMNIQNIWPFARGWYTPIQEDAVFEPRVLQFAPDGVNFKLRSAITGHGQNGEFVSRNHYLNLNGGAQDFVYEVWKECGDNPVYPQGGTWIYDRAGWCPGAATDVHEFDITEMVTPGGSAEIDYGVNGATLSEANYLVSNQLVTYGAANFENDAAVIEITRPSKRVEFERFNPICNNPTIIIRNTGANNLTSVKIDYRTKGSSSSESYTWTGDLEFMESEEVILPISSHNFFGTSEEDKVFEVTLSEPNGQNDEYAANNSMESAFDLPEMLNDSENDFFIRLKTNNRPQETSYTVHDLDGNLVLERDNLSANTTYEDDLDLAPGCYTIRLHDTVDDGLSFWADPNAGVGTFSLRSYLGSSSSSFPIDVFEPEFGSFVQYDFVLGQITSVDNPEDSYRLFSISPNPTQEEVRVELDGFDGEFEIQLISLTGQMLESKTLQLYEEDFFIHNISLANLPQGMYYIRVAGESKVWTKPIVKSD